MRWRLSLSYARRAIEIICVNDCEGAISSEGTADRFGVASELDACGYRCHLPSRLRRPCMPASIRTCLGSLRIKVGPTFGIWLGRLLRVLRP
jgi:hypothetical protein